MSALSRMMTMLGLGAGLMYFYDPETGRRRRALVKDQVMKMRNDSDEFLEKAMQDLNNRALGMRAELMGRFGGSQAYDMVVAERVRAQLGRLSSHPGSINVQANQGQITLSGPILADEVEKVVAGVAMVRGVSGVNNQLEVHQTADNVPGLQGDGSLVNRGQTGWTPSTRLLAGVGGGMLAVYGRARSGLIGSGLSVLGLGLVARGVANMPITRLAGVGRRNGGAIDVQKSINIDAPINEVYQYWNNFQNFPRFMTHVKQIMDLGDGRSHWVVSGPMGSTVEWTAVTTKNIPNQMIAWQSVPEQDVKSSGVVRFDQDPNGGTRVTVRMSYIPPAGALGHAVATLFGDNPRQEMNDDLLRLKSLIETGKTSADGQEVTRQEVSGSIGTRFEQL